MMDVIIRKAISDDVPKMLGLVKELAVFEKAADQVTVSEKEMRDAAFGNAPVWFGWVAELAGNVVGLAICYVRYSTWRGRVLYLEDLFVTEELRGKKIGSKLFEQCVKFCVEKNYPLMTWQVLDWNEGAIRFYNREGAALDPEWINGQLTIDQKCATNGE